MLCCVFFVGDWGVFLIRFFMFLMRTFDFSLACDAFFDVGIFCVGGQSRLT